MTSDRKVDMKTIVEWAAEFFSARDKSGLVEELTQLQRLYAEEKSDSKEPNVASREDSHAGDTVTLYTALYNLRKLHKMLGPLYLGICEAEDTLGARQPWASPLRLQHNAEAVDTARKIDSDSRISGGYGDEGVSKRRKLAKTTSPSSSKSQDSASNKPLEGWQVYHFLNAASLDIPEMIRMLIVVENTRRFYATQILHKRHAQGPLGDQSERWEHGFAKRNIAAETKFENLLVALKELVVLRAIADPEAMGRGDIKQVLEHMGVQMPQRKEGQRQKQQQEQHSEKIVANHGRGEPSRPSRISTHSTFATTLSNRFDPAICLTVLNLMFPLDPLSADRRISLNTSRWKERYTFPLQYAPSPRVQLHQLICEVEAWMNGEDSGVSALHRAFPAQQLQTDQNTSNESSQPRCPMVCPVWLASAHSFAWGQFRQSLQAYLQDTELKIATQHRMLHPWLSSKTSSSGSTSDIAGRTTNISYSEHLLNENEEMLRLVESKASTNATVLEHIIHHSRLADLRFTKRILFDQLER
ncbi:hypothetical protein H4S06_002605 [Coemansia sp. BCRC 34490]|nr:hypothetical protein H4S06_002605 [Coemansia sp. BCRC 34490]